MNLIETLRNAGVVGAGGAGFPTYVKAGSEAEYLIANGAECEPLLHKDARLMENYPGRVVVGMQLLGEAIKARHLVIGIKAKNRNAIEAMEKECRGTGILIHELQDYYPAGDEYELVHEVTGRLIPPKGIPIQVGVVTQNVETLFNIANAVERDIPVSTKWLTITGAVNNPLTTVVPIGLTYRECIKLAGGAMVDDYQLSLDGIMMGKWETDLDKPITKTSGGIIVLPSSHNLMIRRSRPVAKMHRIGKSACDQCSYCTELCPRYLLGYDVQPHKVMRSLGFTSMGESMWNRYADLCCACGLCTLYSCPEDLYPKEACDRAKDDLWKTGQKWEGSVDVTAHPMKDARKVPVKRIMKHLRLEEYDHHAPYSDKITQPDNVTIPLKMHVGEPAVPVVRVGEKVFSGQMIAAPSENKLCVAIHASVEGIITKINDSISISLE